MTERPPGRRAGQSVSLVSTIQRLIDDYPAGLGVVKEFLQNADDAGATCMHVTFDQRQHPVDRLPVPGMAKFMGPSLIIRSDQVFSDDDLERIQWISERSKERDYHKTGQFGLGFNTAYTITDYPAFATRDLIRCFDPLQDAVAAEGEPGREWGLADCWKLWPAWPRAFGISEGCYGLKETIFRLPLRTTEQAGVGRLSSSPFTANDMMKLFAEVDEFSGALLLFMKHVLHLTIDVVNADGTRKRRVRIRSANHEEVATHQLSLQLPKNVPSTDLVETWRDRPETCPHVQYIHQFEIEGQVTRTEAWRVVRGGELGIGTEVTDAVHQMAAIGQNVVPVVGTAVRLKNSPDGYLIEPSEGYLFCTLPLPDSSGLRFHVHAPFALNPSRTLLIHGEKYGDAAVCLAWNNALLTSALPAIVAHAFDGLPESIKDLSSNALYSLWPRHDRLMSGYMRQMGDAIVKNLARRKLLRVRKSDSIRWVSASDVRLYGTGWTQALVQALIKDGLALPEPRIPTSVRQALVRCDIKLLSYTTLVLRTWLMREVEAPLERAPLHSLRDRENIATLLRFFLADGTDLGGLPLALTADGTLRTFRAGRHILLAGDKERQLFRRWPNWFLDASLQKQLDLTPSIEAGLFELSPTLVPQQLVRVLGGRRGTIQAAEVSALVEFPSNEWLEQVLLYLISHIHAITTDSLRNVNLVPDQFRQLHTPFAPTTPRFAPMTLSQSQRSALDTFQVPLVTGPDNLVSTLRLFSNKFIGAVTNLEPGVIVTRLLDPDRADFIRRVEPAVRDTLLSLLCHLEGSSPLNAADLKRLATVEVWPTNDGKLRSAQADRCFVPTGYSPPTFGDELLLFETGLAGMWVPLLRRLGAKLLQPSVFLNHLFTDVYPQLGSEVQRQALEWLATSNILEELEKEDAEVRHRTYEMLKNVKLVLCTDGKLHRMRDLYDPTPKVAKVLSKLLGEHAAIPESYFVSETLINWLPFFRRFGLESDPRPHHLLSRITELSKRSETFGSVSVEPHLVRLLEHMSDQWDRLKDKKVGGTPFSHLLAERAWMPALRGEQGIRLFGAFAQPEDRLYKPQELLTQDRGHLVASQVPLLATSRRISDDMRKSVGIRSTVRLDTAVTHFQTIIAVWEDSNFVISEKQVSEVSSAFLRLLGGMLPTGSKTKRSLRSLAPASHMKTSKCVWDLQQKRFFEPYNVFTTPVPQFGRLRAYVPADGPAARALEWLGCRKVPEPGDYARFLSDLALAAAGEALDEESQKNAVYALMQLDALQAEQDVNVKILSSDSHLRPPSKILLDDARWWRSRIEHAPLAFLHEQVSPKLAGRLGVRGASKVLREVLVDSKESDSASSVKLCRDFERHLLDPRFRKGLRRLLYNEHQVWDVDLSEALSFDFQSCNSIRTSLAGAPLAPERKFGEEEVSFFLSDTKVLITGESKDDIVPTIAEALNRRLPGPCLSDRSRLEEILRIEPHRIESALDRRNIPHLPPDAVEFEPDWPEQPIESNENQPWNEYSSNSVEEESTEDQRADSRHLGNNPTADRTERAGGRKTPDLSSDSSHSATVDDFGSGQQRSPRPSLSPIPGDGSSSGSTGRRGSHLRTYLTPPAGSTMTDKDSSKERWQESRRSALDAAIRYETDRMVQVVESPGSDSGCHIVPRDQNDANGRFIVVKGIPGPWDNRGVAMNPDQVKSAHVLAEKFWLYVVEFSLDQDRTKVHAILNPILQVTEYRLDDGWRELAEPEPGTITKPAEGLFLWEGDSLLGCIETVEKSTIPETSTEMIRLILRNPAGEAVKKVFRPSRYRLTKDEGS